MIDLTKSPDKIRASILQAAMSGQLTQQLPEDGTAEDLIKEIDEEKKRLIEEDKIKKQKALPEIEDDEIPFDIPSNWKWVRLGNINNIVMGQSPKGKDVFEGSPNSENYEFHQGKTFFSDKVISPSNKVTKSDARLINSNYIIMSVRAPVGDVNQLDRTIYIGRGLCGICPYKYRKDFLYYYLSSQKNNLMRKSTGSTFKAINKTTVFNHLIPLPPLAEQQRIVDKLDELLPKVSELKENTDKLEQLRKDFPNKIRQSLLQAAMKGDLTNQLPEDGSADDLLKEIDEEKKRLIEEGKIKKQKALPEIEDDEIPFEIPSNWKWVRLEDISTFPSQKSINPDDINDNTWVLDLEEIEKNTGKLLRKITKQNKNVKSSKVIFKNNDVLYSKLRPYLNKVIVARDDGVATSEILVIHLLNSTSPEYVSLLLRSPYFSNMVNRDTYGTKMPRAGNRIIRKYLLPLPPLAEQQRIVKKLDELFSKLDD